MKPIKITMSAFGSYAGVETIPFDQVENGIFLITGDTGAGKTTVFDAITYALYDQTSGGRREGDMMRSQYAEEGTPTFVEFTFSYRGQCYAVRRNPSYKRVSKRRNKEGELTFTTEAPSVTLTMPDQTEFPGKIKEVNQKIEEILGVDVNQFTQISMIAQGEFLKLLLAPSKERKEIFGKIFDTRIYEKIQNQLRDQGRKLKEQLDQNELLCRHEIQDVRCVPQSRFAQEWEESQGVLKSSPERIPDILKLIQQEIREKQEEVCGREEKNQKQMDEIMVKIRRAQDLTQLFSQAEQMDKDLAKLRKLLEQQQKREQDQRQACEEAVMEYEAREPELSRQIAEFKSQMPKYMELKERKMAFQKADRALQQEEKQRKRLEDALKEAEQGRSALEEEIKKQEQDLENLQELKNQEKELSQRQSALREMEQTGAEMEQTLKRLKQQREKVQKTMLVFQEKSAEYEKKNRIFIEKQVGIIAETLAEGEPCPVCGSREHPNKARLSGETVTQQEVNQAKEAREQSDKLLNQEKERFQKASEVYESQKSLLLRDGQKMFGETFEPAMTGPALAECIEQQNKVSQKIVRGEEKQRRLEKQRENLETWKQQILQQQEKREEAEKKRQEAEITAATARQAVELLRLELPLGSEEELQKRLQKAETEKKNLERKQKEAQQALQETQKEMAKNQGSLLANQESRTQLAGQLKGKERPDLPALAQEEAQGKKERSALEKEKLAVSALWERNQQVLEHLETLYQEHAKLEEQYLLVNDLDLTANGRRAQQARLDLQTYVQRRYFKHIVAEANRRLVRMSQNQFILQCRDVENLGKQGEAGLDLDVYDLVTDKIRDVKTLSGGESFLAALAMALGMADVIQHNAGKVHLDTMFIDEGFGSLDDESRGKAIRILQELAGDSRLVGIISHVTELKEQIDRKLVISKTEKGSHAQWILEN